MSIYKISNSVDSSIYIGSTIHSLETRLQQHIYESKIAVNRKLYRHLNFVGWDNVKIELLEHYDRLTSKYQSLYDLEISYIEMYEPELNTHHYTNNDLNPNLISSLSLSIDNPFSFRKKVKPNFSNLGKMSGKIYKISNDIDSQIYIGSTTKSIECRLKQHISASKIDSNRRLYRHCLKIGWDHIKIEQLDIYDRLTSVYQSLYDLEESYIREYEPELNSQIPNRSTKEWYNDNKEVILKKRAEYVIKNYDYIHMDNICDKCGGCYTNVNKSKHNTSKKHMKKI